MYNNTLVLRQCYHKKNCNKEQDIDFDYTLKDYGKDRGIKQVIMLTYYQIF
jgi:hypothetical protein